MKEWNLTAESFELFLNWLDQNPEEAGHKYEAIRRRLLVFFQLRGCAHAEELTDATINIVICKIPTLKDAYHGDPAPYFYAVARNQLQKYFSEQTKRGGVTLDERMPANTDTEQRRKELEDRCLRRCLTKLTPAEQALVVAYYQEQKLARIERRKKLAEQFGCSEAALRTRMNRLRQSLRDCLFDCQEREDHL
jgi:RNA polymerase sigma factor (sigma-70 family)